MGRSRALPSLTCPSAVRSGRTGCAGADSGSRPSRAQQGDPSGARAVLTAPDILGNRGTAGERDKQTPAERKGRAE